MTIEERFRQAQERLERQDASSALKVLESINATHLANAEMDRLMALAEKIPEAVREKSAAHCMQCIVLAYEIGDEAMFLRWYTALAALRTRQKNGSQQQERIDQLMGCAGMLRSGIDNAQLMMAIAILYNDAVTPGAACPLSATNRRPSVLRGGCDLSQWGRNHKAVCSILQPMLGAVLPMNGEGAAQAAVAELLYQKNDLNGAALFLPAATTAKDPEIRFAGLATLARLCRFESSARDSKNVLDRMRALLEPNVAPWLTENFLALQVQFDVAAGRLEPVRAWVESGDEESYNSCCPRNRFLLMARVQALIALGRDREAAMLTEQILLSLRNRFAPLDQIECLLDGAVAWERIGSHGQAMQNFSAALKLAQPYGYLRVFADKGRPMLDLLAAYGREYSHTPEDARFLRTLNEVTKNFTLLCPAMYAPAAAAEGTVALTPTEVRMLHLLDDGMNNRQISEELGISISTVKFHMHNLFEKLKVASRVEALRAAKKHSVL